MQNRFQKIRELGSKGKKCNPLLLEEFQWQNEWVDENCEPVHEGDDDALTWALVDEVAGATQGLRGRNLPRAAAAHAATSSVQQTYVRNRKRPRNTPAQDIAEEDDSDGRDEVQGQPEPEEYGSAATMEEDEESGDTIEAAKDGDGGFHLNDDLLF